MFSQGISISKFCMIKSYFLLSHTTSPTLHGKQTFKSEKQLYSRCIVNAMCKELLANQIKRVKVMEEEGATENVHYIFFFFFLFCTLPAHAVCMHNNIHYRFFFLGGGGDHMIQMLQIQTFLVLLQKQSDHKLSGVAWERG